LCPAPSRTPAALPSWSRLQHEYYGSGRAVGLRDHPLKEAHELARAAQSMPEKGLGDASLYDVRLQVHESEGSGSTYITCSLLGSLVRRVRGTLPLATPISTVSLGS